MAIHDGSALAGMTPCNAAGLPLWISRTAKQLCAPETTEPTCMLPGTAVPYNAPAVAAAELASNLASAVAPAGAAPASAVPMVAGEAALWRPSAPPPPVSTDTPLVVPPAFAAPTIPRADPVLDADIPPPPSHPDVDLEFNLPRWQDDVGWLDPCTGTPTGLESPPAQDGLCTPASASVPAPPEADHPRASRESIPYEFDFPDGLSPEVFEYLRNDQN